MSEAKPDLSRLAELTSGIGLHEHCCLIYETEEEQFAAALPFLRSGLERGEKCFFVADENSGAAYGGTVSENPYYVPPEELLERGQASREVERFLNNILKSQLSINQLRALSSRLNSAREEEGIRIARRKTRCRYPARYQPSAP